MFNRKASFVSHPHVLFRLRFSTNGDTFSVCIYSRASLVAQWLRIRLPVQGTRVRALIWEDPTCRGETKPVRHNY